MASQTKAQEAAEAALSAIEQALQLPAGDGPAAQGRGEPAEGAVGSVRFGLPNSANDSGHQAGARLPQIGDGELPPPFESAPARREAPPVGVMPLPVPALAPESAVARPAPPAEPAAVPANDDRRTVGQILQAMQVRPSRTPAIVATILSVIWAGVWAVYASTHRAALFETGDFTRIEPALALLALLGPIAFFWTVATMARRAQELRLTAQSMTEVAIRLAEPETVATEQVLTLSQAIRREVASMGDGIERALGRASELETVVRSEVATLERSYSENERRIRGLIDALASEREAIVVNAEKVRSAMANAQESLASELASTSARLSSSVIDAGQEVTRSLDARSGEISVTLSTTGERLVSELRSSGADVARGLTETSDTISQTLFARLDDANQQIWSRGQAVADDLQKRGDDIVVRIGDVGTQIGDVIGTQGDGVVERLSQTGYRLHETVTVHGQALETSLAETSGRLEGLFAQHAADTQGLVASQEDRLVRTLGDASSRVEELFTRHLGDAETLVTTRGDHLADTLGQAATRVEELFTRHLGDAETLVTTRGDHLADTLGQAATRVEELFTRHLGDAESIW